MKVLVAGGSGLAGSAIVDRFNQLGWETIEVNRRNLNLFDREKVIQFLIEKKPDVVVDAAAKSGGIGVNQREPVEFLEENLRIQLNLMEASYRADVEKFVFLGSSCIYPKESSQPIREEALLSGPLEPTNSAYAIAKIAGIELIKSYRKQYCRRWISLMPCNLYGPRDNYDVESGHVLPALINKFVTGVDKGSSQIILWGSGKPRREFLHSADLAMAVTDVALDYNEDIHLNVGTGKDISISELANLIARLTGFAGEIVWDGSRPDGVERKVLDVSRIKSLGWQPSIEIEEGLRRTIEWFKENPTWSRR